MRRADASDLLLARSGDAAAVPAAPAFRWPRYFPALGLVASRFRGSDWGNGGPVAPGPAPVCREEQVRGCLLAVRSTTRLQAVRRLPLRDEAAAA
jgi:hypothetical protein